MIFLVVVAEAGKTWRAHISAPERGDFKTIERSGTLDAQGYPLPPAGDSARWVAPWLALCQEDGASARASAHDRFLQEEPRAGQQDVEALGGYLFEVLLGGDWEAIRQAAGQEAVRLHLSLPVRAAGPGAVAPPSLWHQLPWELMVNAEGALAAFGKSVAVTRLVKPDVVAEKVLSIEIPIRVLFVLGRELDDQLRPGAEYLSLLRRLQCTLKGEHEDEVKGVALHTRLLLEATTTDIEEAMKEFKPAVVHLICHGQVSGLETVAILTRHEGPGRSVPKPDPVNAKRLAGLLNAGQPGVRPHAVVLNACNTARIGDAHTSFAEELVQRGIPIAVGMAGEVADAACRLFAGQFYAALVDQRPADVAAAEGRRAALLHFKNHTLNFDWARAVFCQAEGVSTEFKLLPPQRALLKAAEELRPKRRREPFCGRLDWLLLFRDLFQRRIPNLAIESDEELPRDDEERPQLGKSRLLEEIAWQSVLEGWVPVRVVQVREHYSSVLHFAAHLFTILETIRETFGAPRSNKSEVVRVACDALGLAYAPGDAQAFMSVRDQVLTRLQPQQKVAVSNDTVQQMLRADLEALRKDVEAQAGARKGVLILWDQLDQEEGLEKELVGLLGPHGLGSAACPAPVVFTYLARSPGGKKLLSAINANSDVEKRNLQRYDQFETGLACRQFLAWKKYVPTRSQREMFEGAMTLYAQQVDGYPSLLFGFEQGLSVLTVQRLIVQFDDLRIMDQYR